MGKNNQCTDTHPSTEKDYLCIDIKFELLINLFYPVLETQKESIQCSCVTLCSPYEL